MGLLDHFKKKQVALTDGERQWNRMWEFWTEGQIPTPYAELMTYQSEVNNGGHDQYFFNVENTGDLPRELAALESILPEELRKNLRAAERAYWLADESGDDADMAQYDRVFYEHEGKIDRLLRAYAARIEL